MSYRNFAANIFILITFLLTGCASQPSANFNPGYAFSDIQSYALFPRDHAINDVQRLSDFQRNRIELAIEEGMEALNYSYAEQEKADVVVSYFFVQSSLAELKAYNREVKACLVCTEKEQRTLNKNINTETLIIDLLSTKNMRSVYRKISGLKMKPKNSSDENQQLIIEAVQHGLADLPMLTTPGK
ncbi:DUF4136 domain-containing protein [Thalassotalea litorea]|uniref:DUF4136 domain-containing protein n=1 Tax=Thalassotalea litorea TaxID=2020715 RepID=UPI0014854D0B|nr:DUF4136 domain-containing protein [Thalassotalea litorea]